MGKILTATEAAAVFNEHRYRWGMKWHVTGRGLVCGMAEYFLDDALLIANHLSGYYDSIEAELKQTREALEAARVFMGHFEGYPQQESVLAQIDAALKGGGK